MSNLKSRIARHRTNASVVFISLFFLMISYSVFAQTYTYSYMPAMGTYTSTGSGTSNQFSIDYKNGSLAGGTTNYANGQIKATVTSHTSSTITFRVAKESGYFRNGNSGKIFILDNYYGDVYATSFSISNSSTSYVTAKVTSYQDFTGTRTFSVFLVTSDQVYKQYGGKISITGSKTQLSPTVQTKDPTNITSTSAKFNGKINSNGSSTTYYFKYGTSSWMNERTSSKTLSASSGETNVSISVSGLSSGSHYYVQLYAENSGGSGTGDIYTFDTDPAPNNPPAKPSNPSPSHTAQDVATSGSFSWSCSDPDGDALTYKLYLGKSSSNLSLYQTTSNKYCSYSLDPATEYYWYVVASDGTNSSTSPTWNFKTKSNLSQPTNPSPANNAIDVPVSGRFSWSGNNANGVTYKVLLGTSSVDLPVYKTTQSTYIDFEGLEPGENYFWRVAVTNGNETVKSSLWSFKTKSASTDDITPAQAAQYLQGKGVIDNGDPSLSNELLRQQLAKIAFRGIYSIKGRTVPNSVPSDNYPTVYSDLTVPSTYYFQAARALLYLEYGDGIAPFDRNRLEFAPENNIARVDVLKVLMETFNIQPDASIANPFPNDANVSSMKSSGNFKYGYIAKAADLGIIKKPSNGQNTEFRPLAYCTRGEAFTMLARIMQKVDAGSINDPNPGTADYFEPLNITLATISLGLSLPLGNFNHYTKTSFALSGTVPLTFAHSYNSYNTTLPSVFFGDKSATEEDDGYLPLGDGWSHNYHSFITIVGEYTSGTPDKGLRVIVHWGGGGIDVYKSNGSKLLPESIGVYNDFTMDGSVAVIKTKSQMEYRFSKQGGSGAAVLYLYSIKDRNGNEMTINYESGVNGSKRISSVSDGNRSLTFSYKSGTNLVSSVSDPLGRSIKFGYEYNKNTGRYQLSSFTDAKGQKTTYIYGDDSRASTSKLLTEIQLPKGNYIRNQYDTNRRLTQTDNGTSKTTVNVNTSYGSSVSTTSKVKVTRNGSNNATYNFVFDGNNLVTGINGPMGLSMSNTYGNNLHPELPTAITTNSMNVSNIIYDEKGNVEQIDVTGDGQTLSTFYEYDSMNNLVSAKDRRGNQTTFSYDSKGNLTRISAPEGVTTSRTVNSKGLSTEIIDPMGVKTQFEYNTYGNLTKTTLSALGLSNSAEFDDASRLISATDALNRSISFDYDDNDNLIREIDPANYKTDYDYDKNDNLLKITNAKGGVTSMSYDNATDWLRSVEFAGATKEYSYNDDGSPKIYIKPDGTVLNYSYDELQRITDDGINTYTYDSQTLNLKSVTSKTSGKTLTFSYDDFSRIVGTDYDGHSNTYTYDANNNCTSINDVMYDFDKLNRLVSVKFSGGKTIRYTYRKDSKLSKVEYPNGMITEFGYDVVARLRSKRTTLSNGTVVASYTFELDKAENIIKQTAQEPYGDIMLQNEEITYTYNSGNRITKAGDISFSFDENGNTTKRGSEQYQWNEYDRLIRAGSTKIEYNPLGMIETYDNITFTIDPLGIGNILSDSKSGTEYIYGNGLEARVKNGKVSYYVTDARGSVVAIVDEDGNITHKYQYDEFGKVTQKEEADYNPFQYVGKYGVMALNDHQYYMRARHYDPTIGRFLSEDPIWSTNLYPYADNNPIMGIDYNGNKPQWVQDAIMFYKNYEWKYFSEDLQITLRENVKTLDLLMDAELSKRKPNMAKYYGYAMLQGFADVWIVDEYRETFLWCTNTVIMNGLSDNFLKMLQLDNGKILTKIFGKTGLLGKLGYGEDFRKATKVMLKKEFSSALDAQDDMKAMERIIDIYAKAFSNVKFVK